MRWESWDGERSVASEGEAGFRAGMRWDRIARASDRLRKHRCLHLLRKNETAGVNGCGGVLARVLDLPCESKDEGGRDFQMGVILPVKDVNDVVGAVFLRQFEELGWLEGGHGSAMIEGLIWRLFSLWHPFIVDPMLPYYVRDAYGITTKRDLLFGARGLANLILIDDCKVPYAIDCFEGYRNKERHWEGRRAERVATDCPGH
ncbi:hypothetical protein DFH94DRAFT_848536 [Russula ochroleuca]|jgi:hypothetical protein|uniref:Uncharacterized protein n=1 Tax=Russula ochroleuca TaxID=152965 RepID=A0A9P5MN18_9AGAM|nr:hypothetical protein DFH94DRAFT_848536 [Russula ochroleuca]